MNRTPKIIAEVGSNFDSDLVKAKELIHAAAQAGADVVKFQLFSENSFKHLSKKEESIFEKIKLDPEWLGILDQECKNFNVQFLASVFDTYLLDKYIKIKPSAIKIASSEVTNFPLLQKASFSGIDLIISTGMSDFTDIETAIKICEAAGTNKITLMQCSAIYPCPPEQLNLNCIKTLNSMFGYSVGFSDHTDTTWAACVAVALGCRLFEKHFTLSKEGEGPDHFYALEPNELEEYIKLVNYASSSLGSGRKELKGQEKIHGRREGLYAKRKIVAGEKLNENNTYFKRPALGIRPYLGPLNFSMKVNKDLEADSPIDLTSVEFI